jgi:hypothetical protein
VQRMDMYMSYVRCTDTLRPSSRRPLRGYVGSIPYLVFTLLGLTSMNECPVTLCSLILLDVAKEVSGPAEGSVSDRDRCTGLTCPLPFVRLDS